MGLPVPLRNLEYVFTRRPNQTDICSIGSNHPNCFQTVFSKPLFKGIFLQPIKSLLENV